MRNQTTLTRRQLIASGLALASTTAAPSLASAQSPEGPQGGKFALPLAQDYTIVAKTPAKDVIVCGPGLAKLPGGGLFASIPFWPRYTSSLPREVRTARSDDGGRTWKALEPLPHFTVSPWVHDGKLYLFAYEAGKRYRNENVLILRSDDEGKSWSSPVTLFKGPYWNCPTGTAVANGRVYLAVNRLDVPGRGTVVLAGDLSGDLMDPKSWRISPTVAWPGAPAVLCRGGPDEHDRWLEPNVVNVRGRLMVIARCEIARQTTANICGVCDLEDDGKAMDLRFTQFYPMPGGHNKFHIIHDDVSGLFWTPVTLVTDSQGSQACWEDVRRKGKWKARFSGSPGNERRLLMLMYSLDALNWFQAGCIAMSRKLCRSFMYAAPLIDGRDMLILSRTSKDGLTQHDADLCTFHRVRNFRSLALNLYPEI